MFAQQLESFNDHPAVALPDGSEVSYAQLAQLADACYATLAPGTVVAIECRNTLASLVAYLGALRRPCPALLLDAELPAAAREQLYAHYGITRIYGDAGWHLRAGAAPAAHADLALLLSTSGSTGSPKLVRLSAHNLHANAVAIADYLALDAKARPITTLPIHYSYGMSVINSHFQVGATVLLTDAPLTARSFWQFMREGQANSLAGVPAHYQMLKQLRFERMDLPHLRTLTQAGGRMAPDLVQWYAQRAAERDWRFFVMYGQTEAAPRMAYLPCDRVLQHPDAIGVSVPGGRIDLVDGNGNIVNAPGQVGEIVYHGENVMLGYARNASDLLLGNTQGGVLPTGDLARRDAAGLLYIQGRLSRFIKIAGHRIGLDDIEAQLSSPEYTLAATGRDEQLMIAYQGEIDEATLLQRVASRYHLRRQSVTLMKVNALPRSTSGKIRYAELQEQFA